MPMAPTQLDPTTDSSQRKIWKAHH